LAESPTCSDCHFFVKTSHVAGDHHVFVATESERTAAKGGDFGWVRDIDSLSCWRGVWDEGVRSDPSERTSVVVSTRRSRCFFWPHEAGAQLQTVQELQERAAQSREASKSRLIAWIAVGVAAGSMVVAILSFLSQGHWWPF
jgi:hypothetical protein